MPRSWACANSCPNSSGSADPVKRDAARQFGRQFVESGNQPGAVHVSGVDHRSRRGGTSCQPRVYSSRVASPPSPRNNASRGARLTVNSRIPPSRRPSRSTKSRSKTWVSLSSALVCHFRAAVKPPRHLLPQLTRSYRNGKNRSFTPCSAATKRRERREGDPGAQVQQHRMHRLGSEVFGEFFADGDVADRLTLAEPQRLQRTGPVRPPRQLHVGEGLEQLLRTHALQPLDRRVDGFRRIGCRLRSVDTGDTVHGAVGVQRPLSITNTVRAAVHLELPAAAVIQRMQSQLHLTRSLLGQNDRLIEEDLFDPRRRHQRRPGPSPHTWLPERRRCHR